MKQIIVIGGGASGMMAAYAAGLSGAKVLLLEQNEKLGKKIYITGKGRCNFTNSCSMDEFFQQIVTNPKFLYSALSVFNNEDIIQLIQEHGVPVKIERGNRAFPVSDHASDITKALSKALAEVNVTVKLQTQVLDISQTNHKIIGVVCKDHLFYEADAVILATGGMSYPTTGSTGDGYRFAQKLTHTIKKPHPALVALVTKEEYIPKLQGLSLRNVTLTILGNKKPLFHEFGELLFTHFGVSGPLGLSASSCIYKSLCEKKELKASIDLKPAISYNELEERLKKDLLEQKQKEYKSFLKNYLPNKLIPEFIILSKIDSEIICGEITKDNRKIILSLMKQFPFTICGLRDFKEAIITQGGVCVKEVNPKSMESKLVKGLFFAGEVLDIDAYTGGYNLQLAFSTGYLAGIHASKNEGESNEY